MKGNYHRYHRYHLKYHRNDDATPVAHVAASALKDARLIERYSDQPLRLSSFFILHSSFFILHPGAADVVSGARERAKVADSRYCEHNVDQKQSSRQP